MQGVMSNGAKERRRGRHTEILQVRETERSGTRKRQRERKRNGAKKRGRTRRRCLDQLPANLRCVSAACRLRCAGLCGMH